MNPPINEIKGFYNNGNLIKTFYYDNKLLFSRKGLLTASGHHGCPYKAIYRYQSDYLTAYKIGGKEEVFFDIPDTIDFLYYLNNYDLANAISKKFL